MAKISEVVLIEIPLLLPKINSKDVIMEILWKDTMFQVPSKSILDEYLKKRNEILRIMEERFGTFPKTYNSYSNILNDIMNIPNEFKNIVLIFTYKSSINIIMNSCVLTSKIIDRSIELYSKPGSIKEEFLNLIQKDKIHDKNLKKLL